MDDRAHRVAAIANAAVYDSERDYVDGAPHIKHKALRSRYGALVVRVYDEARARSGDRRPRILDLGAGEGSVTLPFLELGCDVIAVDISTRQLEELRRKAADYARDLETRCQDVMETLDALAREGQRVDVVVCNSFLHHVPDYLDLIRKAAAILPPGGLFFSFQDPLRHDTVGWLTRTFTLGAYLSWRVFKGDLAGGLRRRLRRSRGIYLDTPEDNAEYHATRGGVDQVAIFALLEELGFSCEVISYFSTQSRIFQPAGTLLGLDNTFGLIARNR
jgi:SAM-dependent methyltransferase